MFVNRWNAFDDIFNFQRDAERLFNQIWNDRPAPPARPASYPYQVQTNAEGWRVDVPMPGIDPKYVTIETTGTTLSIRAEQHGGSRDGEVQFSQTLTVPQFIDLDRMTASHRHGMLELTLPLKESVKPRRIPISSVVDEQQKQLTTA